MTDLHVLDLSVAAAFVVRQNDRTLLVDCGVARDFAKLERWLTQRGWAPDLLFLTHVHVDHAGGVTKAKERWGMPVACSQAESTWAKNGFRRVPPAQERWAKPIVWLGAALPFPRLPAFEPDLHFEQDFDFRSHGFEAALVPTPGHSPGHVSILLPGGVLLAGDAVAGAPRRKDEPRLPCFGEDRAQMVASAKLIASKETKRVVPSHGAEIRGQVLRTWAEGLRV